MFSIIKYSIPETVSLGLNALIPAFVIGGLSISITNGGIGIFPYTVSLVLISSGISKDSSLAFWMDCMEFPNIDDYYFWGHSLFCLTFG